jgi:glycosyltransferase involved in cell wall biosynthesis
MDKIVSVIIPLFNEAGAVRETLQEILRHTGSTTYDCEVILIDDGSTDGTWDIVTSMAQSQERVKGIRLSRNFGKEAAIAKGLEFASGDAVIVIDGDGQHPPELIPAMLSLWEKEGVDIVEAVKTDRGNERISSTTGAKLFYWLMNLLSGIEINNSSDFKLLGREVVDAHNRLPESSRFFRGIVSWLGYSKVQIPFSVRERTAGRSGWSLIRLVKLALDASTSFSSLPLHVITILGMITFLVSIILGVQTLYMKYSGAAVSGFTTVILLLLLMCSVLMVSLGIIGVYLGRIFEEVKRRPGSIVRDSVNVSKYPPSKGHGTNCV